MATLLLRALTNEQISSVYRTARIDAHALATEHVHSNKKLTEQELLTASKERAWQALKACTEQYTREQQIHWLRDYAMKFYEVYPDYYERIQKQHIQMLPVETKRVLFTCKNKKCKHVWAYEYYVERHASGRVSYFRMVNDQKRFRYEDRASRCPKCERRYLADHEVAGKVSEQHKCDARCMYAHGPDCSCQCGGANHGRGWLLQ